MTPKQNLDAAIDFSLKDAYERGRTAGIHDVLGTVRADEAMYSGIIAQAQIDKEPHDYTLGQRNALQDVIREWGR